MISFSYLAFFLMWGIGVYLIPLYPFAIISVILGILGYGITMVIDKNPEEKYDLVENENITWLFITTFKKRNWLIRFFDKSVIENTQSYYSKSIPASTIWYDGSNGKRLGTLGDKKMLDYYSMLKHKDIQK